ncbi:peptidylprolyl isomerase [Malaciobacter halophilus]|uniref:Peptidylprolyl isomerase n=1 Tax=Malaciobacter halophilus TaxID=197482 RepID=A0A2N1J691_9BACT|nr:peptidyl-prolyl cis-trans isomerase [Malaciobacter halophilus]AXH08839.1 major antigenic peptide / PpiC-type peptidyl-prolyl cis-trans isomerase [Malaciobacter halophilus]PKI82069.1 peptidylprolyl isomerase [Malaciobacter halophilus]
MRKIVTSVIATLALSTATLSAADSYATVNGEKITKNDLEVVLRNPNIDFDLLPKDRKDKAIQQAIEKKLLTSEAIKSGVQKDKAFKDALERIKKDLALEIWMQNQFKKIKVTEKEQKDYYNTNKSRFKTPATLEARHILLKTEADAKKAIEKLNKAKNKKETFVKLAGEMSKGPTASKGGYLGKFPENRMVPEFSAGAKALNVGEYSKKPVKTQFGYHVIFLESKEPAKTLEYAKVQKKIEEFLLQDKFRKSISDTAKRLKKQAKIVIK